MIDLRDRTRGCLLGVAIGDALGMPYEKIFTAAELLAMPIETFDKYSDPPLGHQFHDGRIKAGETTDDTQLTRVVGESLCTCGPKCDIGNMIIDLAHKHVEAKHKRISGWGRGTLSAIDRFEKTNDAFNSGQPDSIGNGVMMKISSVGIVMALQNIQRDGDPGYSFWREYVYRLTRLTHLSTMAMASGMIQADLIRMLLLQEFDDQQIRNYLPYVFLGRAIDECSYVYGNFWGRMQDTVKESFFEKLLDLQYHRRYAEDLVTLATRYGKKPFLVNNSLPLTYACFLKNPTSFQSVIDVIRCGGDTDTNASCVGALLGALNGTKVFPQQFVDDLKEKDEIIDLADRLYDCYAG